MYQLMVFVVADTRGLTYFDVKVFNPTTPSYCATSVPSLYRRFEKEKRKKYEQRIREVELCFFVPLVFSTYGEMSGCTHIVYRRLGYLLSLKSGNFYCLVMAWLCCCIIFSFLHSAIDYLREHAPIVAAQSAIRLLILP